MQIGLYSLRPKLLAQQRQIIEEFNQTACLELSLQCYSSHLEIMQNITNVPLDILFYDIVGNQDVIIQLTRIVQLIPHCKVILLSDSERHAIFGYSIHAANYLLTPLEEEDYLSTLLSLLREDAHNEKQHLPVKVNGVWSQVNMQHITYLESSGHYLLLHINDGRELKIPATFRDYRIQLELNTDFFRCHKSNYVNLRYVKSWEMERFTMYDDKVVSISRPYWQSARSVYACYVTQTAD